MSGIGGVSRSGGAKSGSGVHDFEGTTRIGNTAGFHQAGAAGRQGTNGSSSTADSFQTKQLLAELKGQSSQQGGPQQSDGSTDDLLQELKQLLENEGTGSKKHAHHHQADAASSTASADQAMTASAGQAMPAAL